MPEHDPRSRFEDEGIPDLQDGTPQQQWAVDPQEAPLPGDRPVAVDDFGTTFEEQVRGEPLEGRLAREEPEEQAAFGADPSEGAGGRPMDPEVPDDLDGGVGAESGLGPGADLDTGYAPDAGLDPGHPAQPEEPSGAVWDEPRPAGRLVDPDQGGRSDIEADLIGEEVGPDGGGYTAEEAAMRVEPE
ncbi:hypothetical protein HS045_18390 [Planomonospora sp. ID82291]|nr:hypothetical protein [Planomonospora sp. ID82291]